MNNEAAIVIPTYNHGERVGAVARRALALGLRVIVVNDGSTDRTAEVLDGIPGLEMVTHPANMGKGRALQSGFAAALPARWAVTLDADGQHDPAEAPSLLTAAHRLGRGVVVGARREMLAAGAPWISRWGRLWSNFWVWLAGGPRLADSQCGFRVYPLPEILALGCRGEHYDFEVEVLALAGRRGLPVAEVPVRAAYGASLPRISHFQPGRDFWRNTRVFSRLITLRLVGLDP